MKKSVNRSCWRIYQATAPPHHKVIRDMMARS